MTDVFDYIQQLKLKKCITSKQLRYIDNIYFYIDNLVIYKYIIAVNPKLLKKAKKYGLQSLYNIHDNINTKIKATSSEFLKDNSNGRYILMYNPGLNEITICAGEDYTIKNADYGIL